jgi:hypothetical protein
MKTLNNNLGAAERQANIDALIGRLIKSKKELLDEIKSDFEKPQFQEALKQLRAKNAKQQATIGV